MKKQWVFLILLLLFIATTTWVWLTLDTQPPWWDQSKYLQASLHYARCLQKLDLGCFFNNFISFNRARPPLVMLLNTPVYFFNYRNEDVAVMINVLFMAFTFLIIFKICKDYLNPKTAVLSCFLLSIYPVIYGHMRTYLMDIALMSIVSASIYLLLKCDGFRNLKYSILLGLSLGLGILTRQSYPAFVAGPFVYIVYKSGIIPPIHKDNNKGSPLLHKPRLNFLYCLIVAIALTSPWYIPNFKEAMGLVLYNNSVEWAILYMPSHPNVTHFLTSFLTRMMFYGVTAFFVLLFLCSSIFFFFFKRHKLYDIKRVFTWWMLLPFLMFTFSLNKQERFFSPSLPAVAIITAQGIYQIKNRLIRWIGIGLIVVVGLFQFSVDSFNTPILLPNISFKPFPWHQQPSYRPMREEWMVEDVLFAIKRDMEKEKKDLSTVMLLSDHKAYNANTLNYYSSKERLGIRFLSAAWIDNVASVMEQKNYHYIIYKDANNYATIPLHRKRVYEALVYLNEHLEEYRVIYKRSLLDGSNVIIYKMNKK